MFGIIFGIENIIIGEGIDALLGCLVRLLVKTNTKVSCQFK